MDARCVVWFVCGLFVVGHAHCIAQEEDPAFRIVRRLRVGAAPHQVAFDRDGRRAYIAVAGTDKVVEVDTTTLAVVSRLPVRGTPLGVAPLPGVGLAVARFRTDRVSRFADGKVEDLTVGDGPSFLVPLPGRKLLVSVERANRLTVIDTEGFRVEQVFATGKRPFPPAPTSDGRKVFVPNYDEGTVTVVDLWNARLRGTTKVGPRPSGGVVLPGDIDYAVAVRGANHVAFVNTASHRVAGTLETGIGDSPFSVVVSPDGRWAFVNNTGSHDVSVVALPERRVIARIKVGRIPIALAVSPDGRMLWVACEGSHEVDVVELPATPTQAQPSGATKGAAKAEVAVLGMIHGRHRKSARWGLDQVRATIERFAPDVICVEIPPNRWDRIRKDWVEHGVIEDERVRVFPEYTDVLLPLLTKGKFVVEPCAGWTKEMAELRRGRLETFSTAPKWRKRHTDYGKAVAVARARDVHRLGQSDDPQVIHSAAYDAQTKTELSVYDAYLNDFLGPGGWSNINRAHMHLIRQAIARHPGARILITFGAGHKYWFLEKLRAMPQVILVDVRPFLPRRD